jgi:hypothetical protein
MKILNLARAYLSLPQPIRAQFRKVRKAYYFSRQFQNALTQVGSERRLEQHRNSCLQAYESKKAKVEGKIGGHAYIHSIPELLV